MPGMSISFWHGLWMPRGVPKDVLAKVNAAVVETLADETVRKRLAGIHQEISAARATGAGRARCLPEGRDRQMVADHQGRGHQGAVKQRQHTTASAAGFARADEVIKWSGR
jgi:hypothetical protein